MLAVVFVAAIMTRHANANGPVTCNVLVSIDRSGSIGSDGWSTLSNQMSQLADPILGLTSTNTGMDINLGFMTFSQSDNVSSSNGIASTDFDAPSSANLNNSPWNSGYVTIGSSGVAAENALSSALRGVTTGGETNYAQALGYDTQGTLNNLMLSRNSTASNLMNKADVFVLLTDGVPNNPGVYDNNPVAIQAGNLARHKYDAQGTVFVGGFISDTPNFVPQSLITVLNNGESNQANVGPVSINGSVNAGIYTYLAGTPQNNYSDGAVVQACRSLTSKYDLQPSVQPDQSVITSGQQPSFSYSVNNATTNVGTSAWHIYDVMINPDANVGADPFACGAKYCGGNVANACANITAIIGGASNGTCQASADSGGANTGSQAFQSNVTTLYSSKPANVNTDSLTMGTRICRVLQLDNADGKGASRLYGACVVVGKTPLVQILGGDVRVGRHFTGDTDTLTTDQEGIYTSRFAVTGANSATPNGLLFGSWVQYGELAPGPIINMASLSGYDSSVGGYAQPATFTANGCSADATGTPNRLTFSNSSAATCGNLQTSMGLIPDIITPLTAVSGPQPLSPSFSLTDTPGHATPPGLYQADPMGTDITLTGSQIAPTMSAGDKYVIYAPNKTVTITGNITIDNYSTQQYSDPGQIPQIIIIAKDINIDKSVTHIDAWLIAHDTGGGTDGRMTTCVNYTAPFSANACPNMLTINGPVMARQLLLWRTIVYGNQCTISPTDNLTDQSTCVHQVGMPGETFNLPASSILWAANQGNPANVQTTYTTELPPYY